MNTGRVGEALKRASEVNLRYYGALFDAWTSYVSALGALLGEVAGAVRAPGPTPARAGQPPAAPLLLAARAGEVARAACLVENTLAHPVDVRVVPRGDAFAERVQVVPGTLQLQPGEQRVVQVAVPIGADQDPERDHFGEITVPELAAGAIPFAIRRLGDPPD